MRVMDGKSSALPCWVCSVARLSGFYRKYLSLTAHYPIELPEG